MLLSKGEFTFLKEQRFAIREMAQWLKTHAVLTDDLSLVHKPVTSSRRSNASSVRGPPHKCTYLHRHKIKNKSSYKIIFKFYSQNILKKQTNKQTPID